MSQAGSPQAYQDTIRELSAQLVEAQRPILILDYLKWAPSVQEDFFRSKFTQLPKFDKDYYKTVNPLSFDPNSKIEEFREIDRNIRRKLGEYSEVGGLMHRMCAEYIRVIEMLKARGTRKFSTISQELYGSSKDALHLGAPSLKDFGYLAAETLKNINDDPNNQEAEKIYTGEQAAEILGERLASYFAESDNIRVEVSDTLVADAAAGAEKIRLRSDVMFSMQEIKNYEVHEGWVHLGTTMNGMSQHTCTFLSKGTPSSTVTQEGLALIVELFAFTSYPNRVKKIINRINAVNMAEEGADFFDVFEFYRQQSYSETDSYHATVRVFRGSTVDGGAFTKDLSYSKGFMLIYNFIRLAVQKGLLDRIPLLFLGKTSLDDVHILSDLLDEGLLAPPKYVPPQFKDLSAVSAWMIYSLFLNKLDLNQLAIDFKAILR